MFVSKTRSLPESKAHERVFIRAGYGRLTKLERLVTSLLRAYIYCSCKKFPTFGAKEWEGWPRTNALAYFGATTFSITTLSITIKNATLSMTLSIMTESCYAVSLILSVTYAPCLLCSVSLSSLLCWVSWRQSTTFSITIRRRHTQFNHVQHKYRKLYA